MQGPQNIPSIRARLAPYSFHILSGLALTSLGFHLLNQRQWIEADRFQMAARTTILEELTARLRSGEDLPEEEVDRMMKLADAHQRGPVFPRASASQGAPGWKDVLLGRKKSEIQDEVEITRAVKEWELAMKHDGKEMHKPSNAVWAAATLAPPAEISPRIEDRPSISKEVVFY